LPVFLFGSAKAEPFLYRQRRYFPKVRFSFIVSASPQGGKA